ncbi:MAG TPA: N-methyl-L-tryptophan oxidase [Thermoflexales bacterium]|nr:N-methyl-L-tryptophan oxidase [Thermoflexales bacterium]
MTYDVIVVGGGAMGSAAAYHLARDGRKVLLLEQFEFAHTRGSSHGESRIFRFAYPEIEYARFAMQCRPLWHALEADAGEQLLIPTGGLDFADDADGYAEVREVATSLAAAGGAYEELDRVALARRYPQWRLAEGALGVYSPDAGVLRATRCVQRMIERAAAHGAEARAGEAVTALQATDGGVEVVTSQGRYRARKAIVTAGAWVNQVLAGVGAALPVQATQEQVVYYPARPGHEEDFRPPRFTIWIHYRKEHTYGFPILGTPGMKIGLHHSNVNVDISAYARSPQDWITDLLSDYIGRYLPDLDAARPFEPTPCIYTSTADHNFLIGPLPSAPDIIVGSPCSGHGFKFAIGVGRALADLATLGGTEMGPGVVRGLG